ncbi:uncharacterized protein LOC122396524 isoform X5 [Colletes gigas]|uniref:uncharacterized protein LOC122396524 isoform X5 n=1 Tax=Colletes gigas TaxID=935657 RepID=UPI001C9A6E17|nr:uncharacterized protein LOC122396524 isoform X5 [Colletes gigas]
MKILIALSAILAVCNARVVINAVDPTDARLLGQEKCTWGPSYWCENIKTASGCNATKHCIKTIWADMKVPEDNDSVCDICKDMVQQARDQLESNQTQNDLKDVFEGSCKLIRIKPIVIECVKIVDQYIPDLVETLASQMNPSVVCSVAGLCNSAHIDKLLKESTIKVNKMKTLDDDELEPDECTKCHTVAAHMEYKLNHTPRDKMLKQMLNLCAQFDTFTDACSATVLTYFNTIYDHLQKNFNTQNVCHLSGQCSANFHKHEDTDKTPKVEIRPLSSVGMVDVNDDLPCKLCEQLVGHLRDLLVANTTEVEFRLVLDGLCKQTKSFRSECTSIVDEYYPEIYSYLTKNLNTYAVCQMSGLCPVPGKTIQNEPIWPLVPNNVAEIGIRIFQDSEKKLKSEKHEELTKTEVEAMQLPIERMLPFPMSMAQQDVKGKESCVLCEYVLHSMQEFITNPVNEEKLKQRLEYICKKLPESVEGECSEFVDNYGDVIVAILAQEIDPSQVCPMLRLCPTNELMQIWDSIPAKYMLEETKKKPGCPLCLLAITQIYNVIKNDKTEKNIESALDKLCITLPRSLSEECQDLVKGYSKEIVELLIADLTPQEICVYIKMCDDTKDVGPKNTFITDENGEILTNEIPDSSVSSDIWLQRASVNCDICKQALRYIEKEIGSDKEKHKIENTVQNVCKHLPKTLSQSCSSFVTKHGDAIITAIIKDVSPNLVCGILGICTTFMENAFQVTEAKPISPASSETELEDAGVATFIVCEAAMRVIDHELGSDKGKQKVENAVHHVCNKLSKKYSESCNNFVNKHGDQIIDVITKGVTAKRVCTVIGLASLPVAEEFEVTDEKPVSSASSETGLEDAGAATTLACKTAMEVIEKELGSDKGKQKVENVVHQVCNKLPKKLSQPCNNLVNNHGDQIIDVIIKHVSPNQVCKVIGLASLPVAEEFEVTEAKPISPASSETELEDAGVATFIVCEAAMRVIDHELGSDKGKQKVENAVHHVCNKLSKKYSESCNNFVNKHGDQIIDVITKGVTAKRVCTVIGLASLPVAEEFEVTDEKPVSSASSETGLEDAGAATTLACKTAMEVIEKELGSDKGKQKVENVVHQVCNKLPKKLSQPCNNLVNNHGDQIIDVIIKHVSPNQVCKVIGLASLPVAEEFEVTEAKPISPASSETELEDAGVATFIVCEAAMRVIDHELGSDKGKQKVENAVHHVCNKLSKKYSESCNNFVNKHGDQIIDVITKGVTAKRVCTVIGLASLPVAEEFEVTDEKPVSSASSETGLEDAGAATTLACKTAMEVIEKELGSDKGKQKVENVVHQVCNKLPKKLSQPCNNLVNNHGDQIIDVIIKHVSPNQVCKVIGLASLPVAEEFEVTEAKPISPASSETELEDAGVATFIVCEAAMRVIDHELGSDKGKQKVENAVHHVCNKLSKKYSESCNNFVNKHGDQIIDVITKGVTAKRVCTVIGLASLPVAEEFEVTDEKPVSSASSETGLEDAGAATTLACKTAMEVIEKELGSDKGKQKVENVVHQVCNKLPKKLSQPCNNLVNNHGDQIIDVIIKHVSPNQVCKVIGLASLPVAEEFEVTDEKPVSSASSETGLEDAGAATTLACKTAMEVIEKELGSDKGKQKVENVVHQVCNKLPKKVSQPCNNLVNNHGDQIIDVIIKHVSPNQVCKVIGLASLPVAEEFEVTDEKPVSSASSETGLEDAGAATTLACKTAMEVIEKELGSDKGKQKVENVVHQVCNKLPKKLSQPCNNLVNNHGDQIIDVIIKHVSPNQVCKVIGLASLPVAEEFEVTEAKPISPASSETELEDAGVATFIVCEAAMRVIDHELGSDKGKQKVENAVHHVCNKLSKKYSGSCNNFVNKHGDQIIDVITKGVTAKRVCTVIGLASLPVAEEFEVTDEKPVSSASSETGLEDAGAATTLACKTAMEVIEKELGSDKGKQKVENVVHQVCNKLPKKLSQPCNNLVNNHGDQIIDVIIKHVSPNQVCKVIGLASLPVAEEFEVTDEKPVSSASSETGLEDAGAATTLACKTAMEVIEKELGSDKGKQKVENVVHQVCNKLPKKLSQPCNNLVNNHGDQIIDVIIKHVSPNQVCKVIGLASLPVAEEFEVTDEKPVSSASSETGLEDAGAATTLACKTAMEVIEKELGSDKGKQKVENVVHQVCNKLPKKLSQPCNNLVNNHGDQIIDVIIKHVSPNQVCKVIGLASLPVAEEFEVTEAKPISPASSETELEDAGVATFIVCEAAMRVIDHELGSDKGKQKVENAVHHVCNKLSKKYSGSCNNFVNKHGDQIIDVITKGVTAKRVCTVIGLASLPVAEEFEVTDEKPVSSASSETGLEDAGAATTLACKTAMEVIEKELGSDKGKQKVENVVHQVCNKLPKKLSQPCNNLVNNHGDQIIDVIIKHVSPNQVCKVIGLASLPVAEEFEVTDEKPVSSASSETGLEDAGAATTLACKTAMEVIEKELGSDKGKQKVENVVHQVCNKLPKKLSQPCNNLVNNHGDQIIDVIIKHVSPNQVCKVIGLASLPVAEEFEVTDEKPVSSASSETMLEDAGPATFIVCEAAMRVIDHELGSDKGKQKVENAVHHVCNKLSKKYSGSCNNFVNKHGDQIIDVITKGVSPNQVCKVIGLASLPVAEEFEVSDEKPTSSASSETELEDAGIGAFVACDAALHIIDKELGSDKGKQKVENVVHHVCNKLPKTVSRSCNNFINKHGDQVIDIITKGVSPTTVCSIMGLVPASMTEQLKASVVECALCKGFISVVDELLGNSNIDNNITSVVSKACKYLPASKQSKCVGMIKVYGPSIINLIERKTISKEICSKIGICAPADYSTVSLEGSRIKRSYEKYGIKHCTWGPAYWCSTNETAFECKAVEHCKEHVWKADFAPPKQATLSAAEPNA